MKKFSLVLLIALLVLGLMSCSAEPTTDNSTEEVIGSADAETNIQVENEEETNEEPTEEPVAEEEAVATEVGIGDTFTVGSAEVTVKSAEKVESEEYGETLKIFFDWVNKSTDTTSAMSQLYVTAFQGGTGIERVYDYLVINSDNESKEARPDATVSDIEMGFQLTDDSPVEIDFEEYVSFENTTTTITIDPSTLE